LHGLRVDVRLERGGIVGKCGQLMGHGQAPRISRCDLQLRTSDS
jgi:hypothetical protein